MHSTFSISFRWLGGNNEGLHSLGVEIIPCDDAACTGGLFIWGLQLKEISEFPDCSDYDQTGLTIGMGCDDIMISNSNNYTENENLYENLLYHSYINLSLFDTYFMSVSHSARHLRE